MATFDHPSWLKPQSIEWASKKRVIQSRSPVTGAVESIELPAERWQLTVTYPPTLYKDAAAAEAFFSRVVGGVDRIRIYNFTRPQPRGTMRGSPTLAAPITRGMQSLQINTFGTLEAGDFFKIGNQVFQAFDAASPIGGVMTVNLVQRVRVDTAAGAAVQWDKPTALFIIPSDSNRVAYGGGVMESFSQEFDEVYA